MPGTIARKYLALWRSLVFPLCFGSAWPWDRRRQQESRGCPRAVTLLGFPSAPLLRVGMVNTSDSGGFEEGG